MPLSDKDKIAKSKGAPRIVALWKALTALKSTVSFMNTGAHPDDETSAMLAALRFRDGIDISYACSTRGEGGQNDIGTEATEALGVLRTAEMEAACDPLDLRMYWLSTAPDDSIFDFGFSKSGVETLAKWGRDRTLERFVHIIRTERPDIICPTFLDIPGQHGHHRAMTEAAHDVMELAADPNFTGCDLPVWAVKKMYLPAWSGAGQAYDDDLPPPPATLVVPGKGKDPVTGWSYAQIGQQSRAMHATQAMGRWVLHGAEADFPLHLAHTRLDGEDTELSSGLATSLSDLSEVSPDLNEAQANIDAAISAFPDSTEILSAVSKALLHLRKAQDAISDAERAAFGNKLVRKEAQLSRVIFLASGVSASAWTQDDVLYPGQTTAAETEIDSAERDVSTRLDLPDKWTHEAGSITLSYAADISNSYPDTYLPDTPQKPALSVTIEVHGITSTTRHPLETPPVVVPAASASLSPAIDVINTRAANRTIDIKLANVAPKGATLSLDLPAGWKAEQSGHNFAVKAPQDIATGLYTLRLQINGTPASSVHHIRKPHTAPRAYISPAEVKVRVIDAALPDTRIGYIGGGNDRVGHWLNRIGANVTDLSDADLSSLNLAEFDTLVIGIFAMKFHSGLAEAMPSIHDWTRAGGTLLTLYHRPWDNWDPDNTAPYHLEIGQPSLRWRVTNENADVTLLTPDHPLLHSPNTIGSDDWQNWHKERGLYFAKSWDDAYTPLISMHDEGETPLTGAWLAADVGEGRHIHTSLILHHQMEKLTPGAFRIMANLVAKRG